MSEMPCLQNWNLKSPSSQKMCFAYCNFTWMSDCAEWWMDTSRLFSHASAAGGQFLCRYLKSQTNSRTFEQDSVASQVVWKSSRGPICNFHKSDVETDSENRRSLGSSSTTFEVKHLHITLHITFVECFCWNLYQTNYYSKQGVFVCLPAFLEGILDRNT